MADIMCFCLPKWIKFGVPAIIALFLFIFGFYALTFVKDVFGNTTGHITDTSACIPLDCGKEYDDYNNCKYSGTVTLEYNYAGKDYKKKVSPTVWCGDDCCHKIKVDETPIYIKFPDNNPDVVAYFTTEEFYPSYMPILMAVVFIIIGALIIGWIISMITGCWKKCMPKKNPKFVQA